MRAALAALALLVILSAGGGSAGAGVSLGGWVKVLAGGKTKCARGGPYSYWLRKGDPERLLVFFQGGGGCFDERTCAVGSSWFDDRIDAFDDPAYNGGILDLDDADNPFREWSVVYIPSCTGDVHLGSRVVRYGKIKVQQFGWVNAQAALRRAYREFPSPRAVFIAGCSAGSVGSAFHADSIIRRYPKARIAQLGDSLAFVFHRPIGLTGWGAHEHFPPFFRIGNRRFTMTQFEQALARAHPKRVFARFNHAEDNVQQQFYLAVGGKPGGFAPRLATAERTLKKLKNYRSYLACGTRHCALPTSEFYSLRVGGVWLRDWVARLASGRNVGCPVCRR